MEDKLTKDQLQKILDIRNDFYRFCKNNLYIKDKSAKIVKFKPNKPQKALIDYVIWCLDNGKPIRVIILKARQMGLSTAVEAVIYWWTSTHKNITSVIIGHEEASAKNLYLMFRRYYDNSNSLFKPTIKYNTRTDLSFERYNENGEQVGLASVIKTATAKNTSAGRSDTIHLLHACMHPNSPIVLWDGSTTTANDIKVGDLVYTSSGNISPVKQKFESGNKMTYKIRVWGSNEDVILTKEHKVLTERGYVEVKDLTTKDWIMKPKYTYNEAYSYEFHYKTSPRKQNGGIVLDESRVIDLDYNFGYLIGYYLAEGHIKKSKKYFNQVTFVYHKDEKFIENIKPYFNNTTTRYIDNKGITDCYDTFMAHLINEIAGRVADKNLKLFGNMEYLSGVFNGYMDGDGSKTEKDRLSATSIHELIARNINRIGDMLGRHGGLSTREAGNYYGRNCKKTYINNFNSGTSKPHIRKWKIVDDNIYVRVKSITEFEKADVIDIEIDSDDHNFETPIGIISNSEVGEWENGEDLIASIMQTVPMLPNTMIFLESTAKGRGNYFHKEWRNAEKGNNNFVPFFFPWWLIDEYTVPGEDVGTLSEYEEFLAATMKKGYDTWHGEHYSISEEDIPGKIRFYRTKSKEFASDPIRMYQEYPTTPHEAFVASGANVFDQLALEELERECIDDSLVRHCKIDIGELDGEYILEDIPYDGKIEENNGPLKIWEEPKPFQEYVIGADVAEGLATGDYSVAEVVNTSTMETVARWRGHIDPDKFGGVLAAIGTYYNFALIGVEINNHGLTTVQKLRDIFYTNLYKREQGYDEDFEEPTSHLGWKTDARTKRIAIDALIRLIREGINKDKDKVFIEEAFAYVRDERGRTNAEAGEHDDTVMAKAIAFQLFEWRDNDISSLKVYIPDSVKKRKDKNRIRK